MGEVVYGWTGGIDGAGLPFPIADQSSPNAARDIKYLAERIVIDADEPTNLVGLPTSGQPLAFYGTGRAEIGYSELANVVTGSTFTCTDPDDTLGGNNFGAAVWRKGATDWVCVEGDCAWTISIGPNSGADRVAVQRQGASLTLNVSITGNQSDNLPIVLNEGYRPSMALRVTPGWNHPTTSSWFQLLTGGTLSWINPVTGSGSAFGAVFSYFTNDGWPTESPHDKADPARTLDELRELIEAAEDPDHPQHEQLQQLKDELAALTDTRPGENKE